jgi:hypothetical protein
MTSTYIAQPCNAVVLDQAQYHGQMPMGTIDKFQLLNA